MTSHKSRYPLSLKELHIILHELSLVNFLCVLVSVATVNEYALKGLDKMEEKLPILHKPADKVREKHLFTVHFGTYSL